MQNFIDLDKWLAVDIYSEEMRNILIPISPYFIYQGQKFHASSELYQKILRRVLMCRNLLYRKKCYAYAVLCHFFNKAHIPVSFASEKHINKKPFRKFADCVWENSIRQSNLLLYLKAVQKYETGNTTCSEIEKL